MKYLESGIHGVESTIQGRFEFPYNNTWGKIKSHTDYPCPVSTSANRLLYKEYPMENPFKTDNPSPL